VSFDFKMQKIYKYFNENELKYAKKMFLECKRADKRARRKLIRVLLK